MRMTEAVLNEACEELAKKSGLPLIIHYHQDICRLVVRKQSEGSPSRDFSESMSKRELYQFMCGMLKTYEVVGYPTSPVPTGARIVFLPLAINPDAHVLLRALAAYDPPPGIRREEVTVIVGQPSRTVERDGGGGIDEAAKNWLADRLFKLIDTDGEARSGIHAMLEKDKKEFPRGE